MSAISCSAQYFWFLLNYLVSSFNQYEQELKYWLVWDFMFGLGVPIINTLCFFQPLFIKIIS